MPQSENRCKSFKNRGGKDIDVSILSAYKTAAATLYFVMKILVAELKKHNYIIRVLQLGHILFKSHKPVFDFK